MIGAAFRRPKKISRGQVMPLMAIAVVGVLAVSALVVDAGNIYYAHHELAAASDAAALAGAYDIPNAATSATTTDATQWSATSGKSNYHSNLRNVTISVAYKCLSSVGIPCLTPPGGTTPINALTVTERADVPSIFGRIAGFAKFPITATSTAIAKGGTNIPVNMMLVLDTTNSMNSVDSNCTVPGVSSPKRLQCALYAIRTLLGQLDPCPVTLGTCGGALGGSVANPLDQVGLMVFPGLTPSQTKTLNSPPVAAPTASDDYSCPGSNPSITSYNNNPGYLVLPFQSDYRPSDSTTSLNANSHLVVATGGNSCSGGVGDPGGEGTFYAGAIASAQSYLLANQRPNARNVMVLLSDGNAGASSAQMSGSATSYSSSNECRQAITAAQNAQSAGITIYSVAYGAQSSGCSTDSPSITPCTTMKNIASQPTADYFFSDASQSGGGIDPTCVNASRPITSLSQAFQGIAADLTVARLVPNSTT